MSISYKSIEIKNQTQFVLDYYSIPATFDCGDIMFRYATATGRLKAQINSYRLPEIIREIFFDLQAIDL